MATDEAYMLSRNHEESRCLDAQHRFLARLGTRTPDPTVYTSVKPADGRRRVAPTLGSGCEKAAQEQLPATANGPIAFTGF